MPHLGGGTFFSAIQGCLLHDGTEMFYLYRVLEHATKVSPHHENWFHGLEPLLPAAFVFIRIAYDEMAYGLMYRPLTMIWFII